MVQTMVAATHLGKGTVTMTVKSKAIWTELEKEEFLE